MKTHMSIILMILIGILGIVIGYSLAPTDVATVRHGVATASAPASGSGGYGGGGHEQAAGGYGAVAPASSGGYGAAPAPAAGGYGH